MMKKITLGFEILAILVMFWVLISWVDVLVHNMDSTYVYSSFNLFNVLLSFGK